MNVRFGMLDNPVARARAGRVVDALKAALEASAPGGTDDITVVPVTVDPYADGPEGQDVVVDSDELIAALRVALVSGECDAVIHDAATLPMDESEGLRVVAYLPGREARLALCAESGGLDELDADARILCANVRVAAQVSRLRDDVRVEAVAADTTTLMERLADDDVAAVVVPAADLLAIDDELSTRFLFDTADVVPAPGQGVVAIEVRADAADEVTELLEALDDAEIRKAVTAERAAGAGLGASPGDPVSAYAEPRGGDLHLRVRVTSRSGGLAINDESTGSADNPEFLGSNSARLLLGRSASRVMRTA